MESKKVLVTGAVGYIGRHVVKEFLNMGYHVIANDLAYKGVDERQNIPIVLFGAGIRIFMNNLKDRTY